MLVSWRMRSSVGRPGASDPFSTACCLPSDLLAVSEPMSSTSAYSPLAPRDTAKTEKISQPISFLLGADQASVPAEAPAGVPAAGGSVAAGPAGSVTGPAGSVTGPAGS